MILTGDDVPTHLAEHLAGEWATRTEGSTVLPKSCGHPTASRAWARTYLDRLLCPSCFDLANAMAQHLARADRFGYVCDNDGCGQRPAVVVQVPVKLRRRPGEPEVVWLGWYCAVCTEPPPEDREAAA